MPMYAPPCYSDLQHTTASLNAHYREFAHRYKPPHYDVLLERIKKMEHSYREQVKEKKNFLFSLKPDRDRLEEINCIRRLLESLPKSITGSPEQAKYQQILLGALYYRRIVIRHSYVNLVSRTLVVVPFIGAAVGSENSSALYQCIEKMLDISLENKLDNLSFIEGCEAYQQYLIEKNAMVKSAFIRDEPDFYNKLEAFIAKYKPRAQHLESEMIHLNALQNLGLLLNKIAIEVNKALTPFAFALNEQLKIESKLLSSTRATLSREKIVGVLRQLSFSNLVKSAIYTFLPDDIYVDVKSMANFLGMLKAWQEVTNQYTLLGGYVFLLRTIAQVDQNHPDLFMTLSKAIDVLRPGNSIDDKKVQTALTALENLLNLPGVKNEYYDFKEWGGFETLQERVSAQLQAVIQTNALIQEPPEDAKLILDFSGAAAGYPG